MAASRKSGGGNVALALANVKRRSGGAWVTATIAKRRSGGAWVDIFPATVVLTGNSYSANNLSPGDATIRLHISSDGNVYTQVNNGANNLEYAWRLSGASSAYDIFATLDSGTLSEGTTGSWLNLGTTRAWAVTRTSNLAGSDAATITLQIRDASTLAVLDTAVITLTAVVEV